MSTYAAKKAALLRSGTYAWFKVTEAERSKARRARAYDSDKRGRATLLIKEAARRARAKGLEFTLTRARILRALRKGVCERSGLPFDLKRVEGQHKNLFAPSLDRIDNNKGYTDDNVQVVLWAYNAAKGEGTDAEVQQMAAAITLKRLGAKLKERDKCKEQTAAKLLSLVRENSLPTRAVRRMIKRICASTGARKHLSSRGRQKPCHPKKKRLRSDSNSAKICV